MKHKKLHIENKNQHRWDALCASFEPNWTTLTFLVQILPKMDLGSEIQKANVGIRISIVKMPCMPIFRKNRQFCFFQPKFAQKWTLGSEFQKSKSGFRESAVPRYHVCQFSVKTNNFDFFGPNLPKKEIRIWNSGN